MTQLIIDRATLEQLVVALETGRWNTRALAGWSPYEINKDYHDDNDKINAALTSLRAALANAQPAGWQKIETAPEGTMILCANMKAMDARSWAYVAWIAGGKVCGHRMDMPTHWMPLPTPPKEQQ